MVFEVWVVLCVYVVPNIFFALADVVWPRKADPSTIEYDTLWLVITGLSPSILIIYLIYRNGESYAEFGLSRPQWISDLLLGIGLWLVDRVAWGVLSARFWPIIDAFNDALNIKNSAGEFPVPHGLFEYALVIVGCCATGFSEELAMRSYLMLRLERLLHSGWKSILLCTVLFAAWHISQGGFGLLNAGIGGVIFGLFFYWQRRLWPIAFAHALGNFLVITRGA